MKKLIFTSLLAALLVNCQSSDRLDLATPEGSYQYALELSKKKRNEEALSYLNEVKNKYPYSKYATLSELKIADIHFDREYWIEAESAYKVFKELHPKHPQVDYVTYKISMSIFKQLPSTIDRDLGLASKAILYFNETIKSYPNSQWAGEAKKRKDETRKMLAEKELYIADFYFIREVFDSALGRYEKVLRNYQNLGFNARALYGASVSSHKSKNAPKTKQYLDRLAKLFPDSDEYKKAKEVISQ